ncbi:MULTISPECIES: type II toxin-antitoxin system VapC family toxin [Serratia]|jgi:Predicted nucleic acid-binding protein, contains PIN domain|uniref:Ribonuclease VapC n=1 Tax=Serratia marcescens TaxID=615 RepID=A0A1C3HHJ1_SERMA|nr:MULTISPECIES: type II toxin-antitoxin system VapC family toxin [Serratia]MBF8219449.1 type II toxin-antitoxin system VapC family toxin [Serratia ureilytica]MBF4653076.1 type II toxin-antitoxin system VapC family toxin [Serratia marcescens]MBF8245166.1 type II toxin-antitoxin system VapC family toxin [Serratia ureilytica]MBH1917520.1 type II toxin-antitoxin system VapC family toxin [Serratia marcescens]MBH2679102.1 type II toxin-antitoxin system VapC family toxin [Serratia marcescens]
MYMFDTNTVSHLFRQHPQVLSIMEKLPPSAVCISSVTEAELLYGVAKRRNKALQSSVEAFLAAVTVYAWDSEAARCYGEMRANMERKGKIMGALDQLIAAHAQSRGATLVTNDRAFAMVPGLAVEDWTR